MLVILSSVSYAEFKIYVVYDDYTGANTVEENKTTFVIPHKTTGRDKLSCLIRQKEIKRQYHLKLTEDQDKLEECLKKITKNWKRDITPHGTSGKKIIKGYDEELDKKFKRRMWFRLRRGEKIC